MSETILRRYRLDPEGNALAGWSVIVGLAGFCLPFTGGVAVLLGVLGLVKSRKTLSGQGAAVTGILLGVGGLLVHLLIWMTVQKIRTAAGG